MHRAADQQKIRPCRMALASRFARARKLIVWLLGILGLVAVLAFVLAFGRAKTASAAEQDAGIEQIRNERSDFIVRVDVVGHPDHVYRDGEELAVKVVSEKAGYLYLLHRTADGKLQCLFPNKFQTDNFIPAKTEIRIPADNASFALGIGPPFGQEVLKAAVSPRQVGFEEFGVKSLTDEIATPLKGDGWKDVFVKPPASARRYAEHQTSITTVEAGKGLKPRAKRRFGLFVGIKIHEEETIPALSVSDNDARVMADRMKRFGGIDDPIVLVDKEATLARIRKAFCEDLVAQTQPGDTVFLYWSGHGHTKANTDSTRPGALVRYLTPYDGRHQSLATIRETTLTEETFRRWIQDMDGRRLVLILDTCYAGGQLWGEKGLETLAFDFLADDLARTKAIGQMEIAKLASSSARQPSRELLEGDLSIMTHFLVKVLEERQQLTLQDAFKYVEAKVPVYAAHKFPGVVQTPVLLDNTLEPVYLKP